MWERCFYPTYLEGIMSLSSLSLRSLSAAVALSAVAFCTVTAAPFAFAAPQSASAADEVISLTNAERAKAGCPALKTESHLTRAAQDHTEDMAANGYLDHNSSKGDPGDRISAAGYRAQGWAENIAEGQRSPAEVVDAWMNSAGHRANILNCDLQDIGVGYATSGDGTPYWTQDFGTPAGTSPGRPGNGNNPGNGNKPGNGNPSDGDNPGDGYPSDGDTYPGGDNDWGNWDTSDTGQIPWDPWHNGYDMPSEGQMDEYSMY